MIPLKDDAPRVSTPYVTYFLLATNIAVFLFELVVQQGGPRVFDRFITDFGVVPARIPILFLNSGAVPQSVIPALGVHQVTLLSTFLPFFTSMFLHGGFWHLLANMWALWIFGDNVEDHLGGGLYLLLYLTSGLVGSLVHVFVTLVFGLGALAPTVGASGAIAGIMGAYFLLYPRARVLTLVPFLFVFFLWLPAWIVLGYWFLAQFLTGAATAIANNAQAGDGVAFGAHVGGFISGVLLVKLFPARPRRYRFYGA